MGDVLTGLGWCRAERLALLSQVADERGALVICGAPRELGTNNLWVRDALVIAHRRGWVQTTVYEATPRVGRPMTGWAPRRWVINGAAERAALDAAIAKNPVAQQWLAMKQPFHEQGACIALTESNDTAPAGARGETMGKDTQKLAADVAAARVKINEARAAERAKVNQAKAEARAAEYALINDIADDAHRLHTENAPWAEIVAELKCSQSIYYSARKLGAQRAAIAEITARKAAADAEAERKAAAQAADEVRALSLRLAAEADAAISAEAARKAAQDEEARKAEADAPADEKRMLRGAANTMAQIIGAALSAHGIKVVKNQVNRAINTNRHKKRGADTRPIFMFEIRTDWRPEDGILTPPSMTAASAATADEISRVREVLATAQAQIDSMLAAKSGKP